MAPVYLSFLYDRFDSGILTKKALQGNGQIGKVRDSRLNKSAYKSDFLKRYRFESCFPYYGLFVYLKQRQHSDKPGKTGNFGRLLYRNRWWRFESVGVHEMNYNKYKRPIHNPVKIIVTDKMKRTIEETDKYWQKLKLNEI